MIGVLSHKTIEPVGTKGQKFSVVLVVGVGVECSDESSEHGRTHTTHRNRTHTQEKRLAGEGRGTRWTPVPGT